MRIGPYRFFFYSGDRHEPEHVHVERENKVAKFWTNPVRLLSTGGFGGTEINRLEKLVDENSQELLRNWNEFFNV